MKKFVTSMAFITAISLMIFFDASAEVLLCSLDEQLPKIDEHIIFHYRAPNTCIGPAIKKYKHVMYSVRMFDLAEFMKTVPPHTSILFGKGTFQQKGDKLFSFVTFFILARNADNTIRGWNVVLNKDNSENINRKFSPDILNEKDVEMIAFSDAQFILLAEIDGRSLDRQLSENMFYIILEPYIKYLLGLAEGKSV